MRTQLHLRTALLTLVLSLCACNGPDAAATSTGSSALPTPAAASAGGNAPAPPAAAAAGATGGNAPAAAVAAPVISGTPATSVVAGAVYRFQPTVSSHGGHALTFSIQNRPSWAAFNTSTGLLAGSPGKVDVGVDSNIIISVSNRSASAALPPFSISVTEPTASPPQLHYTSNGNFAANGSFVPGAAGFNVADLGDVATLNALPAGVLGLVWLGMCNGADTAFIAAVQPFTNNAKLFGFYLMDEPDPTGQYAPLCTAAHLREESDWIHANVPGARTFIVMMNLGTPTNPTYMNTYNPQNTGIDLFGLDPYPVRPQFTGGVNYNVIGAAVSAAEAAGIPLGAIVPVFQAFGGGGYTSYTLPTVAQAQQLLATWGALVPNPVFDYAYSWGQQSGDQSLANSPDLQAVFAQHNAAH